MLSQVLSCVEAVIAANTAEEAGVQLFAAMEPLGASYLQARVYRRPVERLTARRHLEAGGMVTRIAPPSWNPASAAWRHVCLEDNPLLRPIREGWTSYRFGQFAPHGERRFGPYWDALSEAGIAEAHCATSYGEQGKIASLHLGFAHRDLPEDTAAQIQMAGLVFTERLMALCDPPLQPEVRLTMRERDCLALVADGKTDWEVSVILGIAEATARFHVDNARKKLGAVSRAQAVARMAAARLL